MPDLAATLRPVRLSQAGRDLGDAPEGAFGEGLADAFPAVAVLGADSPTLTPEILLEPFAAGADVALGPCQDGGYYLLAATSLHVGLFRDTPWSTDLVAAETLRHCRALGLQTRVLPTWCDVDVALDRLRADLRQAPASSAAARSVLAALPGGPATLLARGYGA